MSANTAPFTENSRAAEQRAHEPSMEEILASIRRIIADDQPLPLTARMPVPAETRIHIQSAPAEEMIAAAPLASVAPRAQDGRAPSLSAPPAYIAPAAPAPIAEQLPEAFAAATAPADEPPLMSVETDASVATAFQALAATRMMPTSDALNDIVRDMLRPMLKVWLDDNLPVLVERLVRAEIERVARGGR